MIEAIPLDMDGVLYHGDRPLPGAGEFLRRIAHIPHCFIPNNPILSAIGVAGKLERIGLPRPAPDQIITSAQATALGSARKNLAFAISPWGPKDYTRPSAKAVVKTQSMPILSC